MENKFKNQSGEEILISHTLSNGPRLEILNDDLEGWACFDFDNLAQLEGVIAGLSMLAVRLKNDA